MHDNDLVGRDARTRLLEVIHTKIEGLKCDELAETFLDKNYHRVSSLAYSIHKEKQVILQYRHRVEVLTLLQAYKQLFPWQEDSEVIELAFRTMQEGVSDLEQRLKGRVAENVLKEATGSIVAVPYKKPSPQGAQTAATLLKTVQKVIPFAVLKGKSGVVEVNEKKWWQVWSLEKCEVTAYYLPPLVTVVYWNALEIGQKVFDSILEEELYKNSIVVLASAKNKKSMYSIKSMLKGMTIAVTE